MESLGVSDEEAMRVEGLHIGGELLEIVHNELLHFLHLSNDESVRVDRSN